MRTIIIFICIILINFSLIKLSNRVATLQNQVKNIQIAHPEFDFNNGMSLK